MQSQREGTQSPLFYYYDMLNTEKVEGLVKEALAEQGAFLIDLHISSDNRIQLVADHPEGFSLAMITKVSRHIEHQLDRDEEDFALEVSSPGVGEPLKVKEQYEKNVGRPVKLRLADGSELKAELEKFENDTLTLSWKARVPKEVGKGKKTVVQKKEVPLSEVEETRLEIRF